MSCHALVSTVVLGCVLAVAGPPVEAQQRPLPTGTPGVSTPREEARPTPPPPSPEEIAARDLGLALARIDGVTWEIVRLSWREGPDCLAAVDEHLGESLPELKRLVRTSKVMECAADPETGQLRLRLTTDEARRAFVDGYTAAAAALRTLRRQLADDPEGTKVVDAARAKQSAWQDRACRELEEEVVERSSERPVAIPPRKRTGSGSS
jgi:hypothetical protein